MDVPGLHLTPRRVHAFWYTLFAIFTYLYFSLLQDEVVVANLSRLSPRLATTLPSPIIHLSLTVLTLAATRVFNIRMSFSGEHYTCRFVPGAILAVAATQYPLPGMPPLPLAATLLLAVIWYKTGKHATRTATRAASGAERRQTYSRQALWLALTFFYTGTCGQMTDTLHYELRTALLLSENKVEEALAVGKKSLQTTPQLIALRCYAMSRAEGGLGARLFTQPLTAGGHTLLHPRREESCRNLFSLADSLRALPATSPQGRPSAATDYRLCALLLDKQIDRFAAELPRLYPPGSPLPRHYAEAAVLYRRLRTKPVYTYHDPNVEANLHDFLALKGKSHTSPTARKNTLRRQYGTTYWWYYFFGET